MAKKKKNTEKKTIDIETSEEIRTPQIEEKSQINSDELDDLKNQLLRALADNENSRRRFEKEKEDLSAYVISNFAKEMLTVLDNLNRALEVSDKINIEDKNIDNNTKNFIEGVKLTEKQLNSIFEKFKIIKIDTLNQKFDPNIHQAMFEIENNEVEEGTILQVVQEGFKIEDRLLRPALVGVSKKTSD
ncbi:nucleotide exchange factor GrpE [Pelagibacteraceae bacterium]|nr:nucleotide exchange factor GrpE [Pelagibacteraceae bacterium]